MREDSNAILSAAAGIACQLLQSPACKKAEASSWSSTSQCVRIYVPLFDSGDWSPGDCQATLVSGKMTLEEDKNIVLLEACETNDPKTVFVDRLFGTRGETPTTVIQWSKGTIHYSTESEQRYL